MTAELLAFPVRRRGARFIEERQLKSGGSHGAENHFHGSSVIRFIKSVPQLDDEGLQALADALLLAWRCYDAGHKLVRLDAERRGEPDHPLIG